MAQRLTKSKFLTGLSCHKRLWFEIHQPELAAPLDRVTRHKMEAGTRLGVLARLLYPHGELIPFQDDQLKMVEETAQRMRSGVTTLFEATFLADGVLIKADILTKVENGSGWHLIEVKSSKRIKQEFIVDLAVQTHTLIQSGLNVTQTSVLHISDSYRYLDEGDFFMLTDVTEKVFKKTGTIPPQISEQQQILDQKEPPDIPLGRYCLRPEKCPFFKTCWEGVTEPTIYTINNLHTTKEKLLRSQGVFLLKDVPEDFDLSDRQRAQVDRINHQKIEIDRAAILEKLSSLTFPLYFFDFETINPALPWISGTAPFEHMPFQFSLHILEADGTLTHAEYLHTDRSDPHPDLSAAILNHIGPRGSVIVYHAAFERRVLTKLAERLPEFAPAFESVVERLWDLELVFLEDYFHHRFLGKSSIKVVLPVLVPNLSYAGLAVQNGAEAQIAWLEMVDLPPGPEKDQKITDLISYCWQDTIAMVEIYRHLLSVR